MTRDFFCLAIGQGIKNSLPPTIRHIAFNVVLEYIKQAKNWLEERGMKVRAESDFDPKEPIVMPNQAHAMIYFNDPDGNSLEFITRLPKEINQSDKLYLSEWEILFSIYNNCIG